MKSNKVLILEIAESKLKVCVVSNKKNKLLVHALEQKTFEGKVNAGLLKDAVSPFLRARYKKIIISLPRSLFLVRFLELPTHTYDELAKMLSFSLGKLIPYPLDEVAYDFSVVAARENFSKLIVFLAEVKKLEIISEFIRQCNINPDTITLSSWGIYAWCRYAQAARKQTGSPSAIVDIDAEEVDFVVVDKSGLLFSRSFSYAAKGDIVSGIEQSLHIYQKEFPAQTITHAVFTGMYKRDVITQSPFKNGSFHDIYKQCVFKKRVLSVKNEAVSFTSSLGLAAYNQNIAFDFSFGDISHRRGIYQRRKRSVDIAIVLCECLCIAAVFLWKYVYDKYAYLEFLDARLQAIKVEAKELDQVSDKLKVIDSAFSRRVLFSDILYDALSSIPEGTQLSLIDIKDDGDFIIKGFAQNDANVFTIKTALVVSSLFSEVNIKYISSRQYKQRAVAEFQLYGTIKGLHNED